MAELILAIDAGTTSTRAAVFAPNGDILGLARAPIASHSPGPGLVEQDAEGVWNATRDVMARALAACRRRPGDIAAVGVTTQRASAVLWDRATGAPFTPLVIWSDLRGAGRAQELRSAGFMLAPQQAATKLESLFAGLETSPRQVCWGALDSFLIARLGGGAHVTDRSQAWPCGYLSLPELSWNAALIDHQGLDPTTFPALVDTWGEIGITTRSAFGAEVAIACDIADQQSALLAHGDEPGTAKITFGTSGTFDLATGTTLHFPAPGLPPLVASSVAGENRFCVEGMVLSAGSAMDWMRDRFALGDHPAFETLAGSVSDAAGAAFLPALNGLGAPRGDPDRRAALTGLSSSVTRAHVARASLEGLAFRVREIVDAVYELTDFVPPPALGVDGGMSQSGVFLQILADLLGRPVRRHKTAECTLLGAAMAAGRGSGLLAAADARAMIGFEEAVAPRMATGHTDDRFAAWRAAVYG